MDPIVSYRVYGREMSARTNWIESDFAFVNGNARPCGPLRDAGIHGRVDQVGSAGREHANTAISYYTKSAVVAFLLDAKIRRATGGRRSLDEVMREAYARYSAMHGFTPDEFRTLTEHVAGIDLGAFWRTAIEGTDELDYSAGLNNLAPRAPARLVVCRSLTTIGRSVVATGGSGGGRL